MDSQRGMSVVWFHSGINRNIIHKQPERHKDIKMKLYHFTGVAMLHSILTSEGINKGYFHLSDGKMLYGHSW